MICKQCRGSAPVPTPLYGRSQGVDPTKFYERSQGVAPEEVSFSIAIAEISFPLIRKATQP